ncbi:MAG: type II secretion system major pseudopilin GspG [Candidatus Omnitrophota bacterium]
MTGCRVRGAGFQEPKNQCRPPSREKGFTLIELMIVVIIIAGLAAMVVPRIVGRTDQANKAIAKADVSSNLSMALKLYYLDNGRYPTTAQGLAALESIPTASPAPANWKGPYLETLPEDPWGNAYQYKCPGDFNKTTYDLSSFGSDGLEQTDDDIKNWK